MTHKIKFCHRIFFLMSVIIIARRHQVKNSLSIYSIKSFLYVMKRKKFFVFIDGNKYKENYHIQCHLYARCYENVDFWWHYVNNPLIADLLISFQILKKFWWNIYFFIFCTQLWSLQKPMLFRNIKRRYHIAHPMIANLSFLLNSFIHLSYKKCEI